MEEVIPKKSLGQHWLTDQATLAAICAAGDIHQTDVVLEIGPGTGTLTRELVKHAGQVIAVEFDEALAEQLIHEHSAKNLQVIKGDVLKFDLTSLPTDYKVVANIPYYLTSNLVRVLSETANPASRVVLLVQKEVAQRVAAKAGAMSLLSVSAQFYWEVALGLIVPAKLFTPPPKVDSQVIVLRRKERPPLEAQEAKAFFRLVRAGFSARRKTLLNSLAGGLRTDKVQLEIVLKRANIDPKLRPQELSLTDWLQLYKVFQA